jgi:hypothetical protein
VERGDVSLALQGEEILTIAAGDDAGLWRVALYRRMEKPPFKLPSEESVDALLHEVRNELGAPRREVRGLKRAFQVPAKGEWFSTQRLRRKRNLWRLREWSGGVMYSACCCSLIGRWPWCDPRIGSQSMRRDSLSRVTLRALPIERLDRFASRRIHPCNPRKLRFAKRPFTSSISRRRRHRGDGSYAVDLFLGQHRPGDARHLVSHGDCSNLRRFAR